MYTLHSCIESINVEAISTHRALIIRNTGYTTTLNSFLILRKTNFLSDPNFLTSIDGVLGIDFVKKADPVYERLDQNNILIKIMLFIIAFSNNCSLVTLGSSYKIGTISISIDLIHVQDIFVTILWKYLVCQYGFMEAIVRFSALVKCILDISFALEEMPYFSSFDDIFDSPVKQIEYSLVIQD